MAGIFLPGTSSAREADQKITNPHMKLLRNGFEFNYFYLDRIYRIIRIYFACGEGPFGRRPYYPNDPVDPVQFF